MQSRTSGSRNEAFCALIMLMNDEVFPPRRCTSIEKFCSRSVGTLLTCCAFNEPFARRLRMNLSGQRVEKVKDVARSPWLIVARSNFLTQIRGHFQLSSNAESLRHIVDEDPIVDDEEIDTNLNNIENGEEELKRISKTYRSVELKKWRPAPVVRENPGKPGEMGKPVKMKSHQQEEMKEKFKENQFNLLASDMIWLNRSLSDVRHKE
jgi:hypothetical protein